MFVFVILATAISGTPTPNIYFLSGQLRRTILPKERYDELLSVGESDTQLSIWEADITAELSPPQGNLRLQCRGLRWCYDVQLRSYWGTNNTTKRIKLALTIYRDYMQSLFYQIFREWANGFAWRGKV